MCSDALGRLVAVDEPNPGAQATHAQASVTIGGSEQANPLPGAPGSGYVDIGGSEGTSQVCTDPEPPAQPVCHTVPDAGSVSIQVSTYPAKSVTFGSGSTGSSIASALASAFHSDASAPADAVVSPTLSSRILFTARGIGAATNYTLSAGPGSDFFVAPSGATLTGGRDPSSSPDAGSVTITLNGTPYQTTYGGSDTASTIATRLASAITGGAWATVPGQLNPNATLEVLMLIKTGAIRGAAVGAAIAVIMISLDNLNLGRISIPLSSFIDRAIFTVCPFYILGFSSYVTNKPTWFLVTILGNALLYGLLGVLIAAGVLLFRRARK